MSFHPCYLSAWLKKEPGSLLVNMERDQLQRLLGPVAGDYLIQMGGLPELTAASPIRFKWYFNTQAKSDTIQVALDELPLVPESVDVIVMVHVLEFTAKPQVLLREAYQALAPGGQLIVLSVNPYSLWGLSREVPHSWPAWKVKHWLRDLRLRIVMSDTFCFRPPLHSLKWWGWLLWLEALGPFCFPSWGGFYILAAQKRISGKIPSLQPCWTKKMELAKNLRPTIRTLEP